MNLRLDKVVRAVALGVKRVYSLVLTDEGLYLIQTGQVGALKHYRMVEGRQAPIDRTDDRSVKELEANEGRIATVPLDELVKIKDNYFIRLEAIEDVELRTNRPQPEMWIGVTGSEHHLFFPLAAEEEVQAFQRALSQWLGLW
jgi:hypothetical protein